eukprot:3668736-Alexandrium_andersonii.AAC.1
MSADCCMTVPADTHAPLECLLGSPASCQHINLLAQQDALWAVLPLCLGAALADLWAGMPSHPRAIGR